MKKIRILPVFFLLTLIFTSCEKNFDPQMYGQLFTTNYPKTESDYESLLMGCYIPFTSVPAYVMAGTYQSTWFYADGGCIRFFDTSTDFCAPALNTWDDWLYLSSGNYEEYIYQERDWGSHFEKIRDVTRFTQIIAQLDEATALSDTKKKNFLGEAHFLRGMMMYYLLHLFGPVPVIVDPALVGNEEAEKNMVRPTLQQMVEYITADLEFGVANMASTAVKGRYNANYARFCLMKHYLNEGSYMEGYYDNAIALYGELKNGGYSLFNNGINAYAEQFKIANKYNKEVIMAVTCTETATGDPGTGNINKYNYYFVPNNVARYADKANTIPTPFVKCGQGWWHYYNVSPEFYKTYEDGDKRKDVILTSYVVNNNARTVVDATDLGSRWYGYILWKYPGETSFANQPTDIPIARWADVLLMYAEAVARTTQAVPAGEALQAVNDVRARAGLGPLSGSAVADYNGFMDALLAERGHELLYEGQRKIDLIRFNKYRNICTAIKGIAPTRQYIPMPNYAVEQASSYGKTLDQFYERPEYASDN